MIETKDTISKKRRLELLEKEFLQCKAIAEKHEIQEKEYAAKKTAAWITMAKALCEIRDKELYKEAGFKTFGSYREQRCHISRSYAKQICRNVELLEDHKMAAKKNAGGHVTPIEELSGQALTALAPVPEERQAEVLTEAAKSGKVTGKSIRRATAKVFHPDVMEKDKIGRDIPEPAMAVWKRKNELRPQIASLRELHQWAEDNKGTEDLLLRMIDFGKLVRDIDQVLLDINQAIPEVVCTQCHGQAPLTCTFCKGRGMISISLARGCTPIEMKKLVDQMASKDDKFEKLSVAGG